MRTCGQDYVSWCCGVKIPGIEAHEIRYRRPCTSAESNLCQSRGYVPSTPKINCAWVPRLVTVSTLPYSAQSHLYAGQPSTQDARAANKVFLKGAALPGRKLG